MILLLPAGIGKHPDQRSTAGTNHRQVAMAPAGGIGMQRKFFRFRIIQAGGVLCGRKGFHGIPQPEEVFFTFQEFSRSLEQQAMNRNIHGEAGKQFPTYFFFVEKSIRKMEKQKGSRNIREPFTIKYGFFMRALCAFGKSSIKTWSPDNIRSQKYLPKWEFFTDLLTNHSLPVFYLSFTAYLHLLYQNPLKNHL
jgi:hypothetical protein